MNNKELYYELVKTLMYCGRKGEKRHGNYFTLSVYNDYKLILDSWNKSIFVYKNEQYLESLGLDFGGFKCDIVKVNFWRAHLQSFIYKTFKNDNRTI